MKYTIYQITNKLNGKTYIGKHQTKNINDGYFGSGIALKEAIKKYGKENFIKEILFVFETETEMNAKERELITEEFVNRRDTYNLGIGGEGGPHFKGKTHSKETINKIKAKIDYVEEGRKLSKKYKEGELIAWNKGKTLTKETKQKMSEAKIGKKRSLSEEGRKNLSESLTGRKHSEETKQKMREAKLGKTRIFSEEHKRKISEAMRKKLDKESKGYYTKLSK
jgi:hypothetical protein